MKICLTFLLVAVSVCLTLSQPIENDYISQLEDKSLQEYLAQHQFRTLEDVPDKVVGGVEASPGEAPFQAQLLRRVLFTDKFLCGGSLISPRTVLTAGHCVSYFFNYRIRYGSNSRLSSPNPDLKVAKIKLHPKFDLSTVQNDIALFVLSEAVKPGSNVRAIDLQTDDVAPNSTVTLYGFGLTNGAMNTPATKLQKTELNTLKDDECKKHVSKLGVTKHPGMMCASASQRSACNGDSGGPLVVNSSGKQIGIVSFGTRFCPPGSVNVYTNVTHYIGWINENMVK